MALRTDEQRRVNRERMRRVRAQMRQERQAAAERWLADQRVNPTPAPGQTVVQHLAWLGTVEEVTRTWRTYMATLHASRTC